MPDALKLAAEFNRRFTSTNGVDVPERVSVYRDEWRQLFVALSQQPATPTRSVKVRVVEDAENCEFLAADSPKQPATPELSACSLGCATECIAQLHGCTSECPALPARPPFGVVTPEHVAQRDEILAWLRKEAEKEDYFGHKFNAEKLDGAANLIEHTITAPSVPKDGRPYVLALSESEVKALADFHDCQQEEADTTGAATQGDAVRAKVLRAMLAAKHDAGV